MKTLTILTALGFAAIFGIQTRDVVHQVLYPPVCLAPLTPLSTNLKSFVITGPPVCVNVGP